MRRPFPILASVVGLLLMIGFASALIGRDDPPGRGVRLAAATSAVAVHAWTFAHLRSTGHRVEAEADRRGLPGWVGAQAEKNRRKALGCEILGSVIAVAGADLPVGEWWSPLVSGSSLSFQVGSFVGENLIVASQSRLLAGLGDRPDPDSGRPADGP